MNGREAHPPWLTGFGPAYALLAVASAWLALLGPLPLLAGLALAVGGATLASVARVLLPRAWRFLSVLPVLGTLGALVVDSAVGTVPELAGGVAGLALLLWLAEEPERYPGAFARGASGLLLPATVFGIAWTSSLLLPSGVGTVGGAAALLVGAAVVVVLLLRVPALFERDPSATS
jgi:hypothetical protein